MANHLVSDWGGETSGQKDVMGQSCRGRKDCEGEKVGEGRRTEMNENEIGHRVQGKNVPLGVCF